MGPKAEHPQFQILPRPTKLIQELIEKSPIRYFAEVRFANAQLAKTNPKYNALSSVELGQQTVALYESLGVKIDNTTKEYLNPGGLPQ